MPRRALPARTQLRATRGRALQAAGGVELNNWDLLYSKIADVTRTNVHYRANLISGISQGTGVGNRVGRKIVVKEIEWRFEMWATPAHNSMFWYHFAIVLDMQANGDTIPAANLLFTNAGGASEEVVDPIRNLQYADRFRVLLDRRGWISSLAGATVGNDKRMVRFQGRKKVNIPILYASVNPQSNQLVMYEGFSANQSDGSLCADQVNAYGRFRIRYTDA